MVGSCQHRPGTHTAPPDGLSLQEDYEERLEEIIGLEEYEDHEVSVPQVEVEEPTGESPPKDVKPHGTSWGTGYPFHPTLCPTLPG